jgi:hypothetical protein
MKAAVKLIIAATLSTQAMLSQALPVNLLTNGSFESLQFGGSWTYRSNPNDVAGWSWSDGSAMEFWNTPFLGVDAVDGRKIAELNAHGGNGDYSFYQNFETVAGQTYHYSFSYQARSNNNEQFHLGITRFHDDIIPELITQTDYTDHVTGQWKLAQGSFVAVGSMSQIGFWSDDSVGDTTGNLLDHVVVTKSVPEPGSIVLIALGLIGLVASRRRLKPEIAVATDSDKPIRQLGS